MESMEFYAFHGVYEKERKDGNDFLVDLEVTYDFESQAEQDDLSQTINYEQLYEIVRQVMEEPTSLLEKLAWRIAKRVKNKFPDVQQVSAKVSKSNPPIGGNCRYASVAVTL